VALTPQARWRTITYYFNPARTDQHERNPAAVWPVPIIAYQLCRNQIQPRPRSPSPAAATIRRNGRRPRHQPDGSGGKTGALICCTMTRAIS